ncbi:MAG: deoxyguanosinetriphosphate triphosphohydrolase [bacterium]|nr:deoxyguanosinetriphosphate triphosphohydrolase [bacterium]
MTLTTRETLEADEFRTLAPYAARSAETRGRDAPERPDDLRTEFQRDRDRILHCAAFRKLEYKTQVYVTHEGDYFRTRLTHTLEVAQIARTLARNLGLNADLTEAIALAHDLGHTPFGHTGEAVLRELMAGDGGFEHNAQSLRVVEVLEERFHDRPGLNLTWEVREGIACPSTAYDHPEVSRFHINGQPSLEAQVVDLADEIAYNHHDLDDALSMDLLVPAQLREVPWVWEIWRAELAKLPEAVAPEHIKFRFLGALMDIMVHEALRFTAAEIERQEIDSPAAVQALGRPLAGFGPEMTERHAALRRFLMAQVYRHPSTLRMQSKAARFFRSLFNLYLERPELLPRPLQARAEKWGLKRVLVDYLSGMTDRHCLEEYKANFEPSLGR